MENRNEHKPEPSRVWETPKLTSLPIEQTQNGAGDGGDLALEAES